MDANHFEGPENEPGNLLEERTMELSCLDVGRLNTDIGTLMSRSLHITNYRPVARQISILGYHDWMAIVAAHTMATRYNINRRSNATEEDSAGRILMLGSALEAAADLKAVASILLEDCAETIAERLVRAISSDFPTTEYVVPSLVKRWPVISNVSLLYVKTGVPEMSMQPVIVNEDLSCANVAIIVCIVCFESTDFVIEVESSCEIAMADESMCSLPFSMMIVCPLSVTIAL
jgi:hypothetical protein